MSIELYEEVRQLKARVEALEEQMRQFVPLSQMQPPQIIRRKPGPPKGYKRQPRQVAPNG